MPDASEIKTLFERIAISEVRDVQVTEIVSEGDGWVRAIRVYGEPVSDSAPTMILELRISSLTKDDLKVTTPELEF